MQGLKALWQNEDYWAIWFAFLILGGALLGWIPKVPKLTNWSSNPLNAFATTAADGITVWLFGPLSILAIVLALLTVIGIRAMRVERVLPYLGGFIGVFVLSTVAYWIAHQTNIKYWGLSYAMWALLVGLLISNTIGTPSWLRSGAKTELFIKTGLVLLGAEVLFEKILSLGPPGLMVAWIVTPVVVIFMYVFGTRKLRIRNSKLVMIIASATSVCGVSAAIAAAAACRAKKEDLTLAVGMTLIFTVLMMFFMPLAIKFVEMHAILGAAWMGGTIDSTGAVVAAGSMLGPEAEQVAAVVKMIQNVLIGVLAFGIALYWVTSVERDPNGPRPNAMEIWYRFPKFVLGFVAASIIFSFIVVPSMTGGSSGVETTIINPISKTLRGWFFCLAFTSIGLESNFKDLTAQLEGGKPLILYIIGQTFNLILTLLVAYLAFMVLFAEAI